MEHELSVNRRRTDLNVLVSVGMKQAVNSLAIGLSEFRQLWMCVGNGAHVRGSFFPPPCWGAALELHLV